MVALEHLSTPLPGHNVLGGRAGSIAVPAPVREITAKSLIDEGLSPTLPGDRIRAEVLRHLERARADGLEEADALQGLFPHTILDAEIMRVLASAMLSGTNILLLGPPGSGKTNLAKDIWDLYPKDVIAVSDCPVQDDPFSLIDPAFARIVPPCPVCKSRHGEVSLRELGEFDARNVDPAKIPVRKARLREGFGFARIQGSPEVFPDYLTGSLNLRKLEEIGDPESPLVLEPGKLMQANRGVLFVDEVGKLPRGTQNVLLQSLQERIVSPSKSRETFPASFFGVATTNVDDLDLITEPLIGRLASVLIDFNEDHAKNRAIVDAGLLEHRAHGAYVPETLREASVQLMTRWRKTGGGAGDLSEVGSNRTMIDILRRAESYAVLVGRTNVTAGDFRLGAVDAMRGRIRARSAEGFSENRDAVEAFVNKHWHQSGKDAAESVWCEFFVTELKEDKAEADRTVREIRHALSQKSPAEQALAADSPYPKLRRFAAFLTGKGGDGARPADAPLRDFEAMEAFELFAETK